MKTGKAVLGILAGVAVGAALGILFAPDKGSSTRKKILKKGGELKEDLEKKFNDLIEAFTRKFESVKKETALTPENGKKKAGEAVVEITADKS